MMVKKILKVRRVRRVGPYDNMKKNSFEKASWEQQKVVCGIDEVGRGCLAGPLVTAAVILPVNKTNSMLKDSKLLQEKERLKAYRWIINHCWYGFGMVDNHSIDKHNIWQATLIAMKKALIHLLAQCPHKPEAILVDAMPLTLFDTSYKDIPVHHFTSGERRSSSIAAASIIAKVKRDEIMDKFDPLFPNYHLGQHKGYSTKLHKETIKIHKPSIIHRASFLNRIECSDDNEFDEQQTLC